MSCNRVSDADFRRHIGVLAQLPWPVTFADASRVVTTQLGWTPWTSASFRTDLGIHPGIGNLSYLENEEISSIRLGLTDFSEDESDERDTFQHEAFSFYAKILRDMYGPGSQAPFPRRHDELFWDLPSGAQVVLVVGIASGAVSILSPRLAEAHRINARSQH